MEYQASYLPQELDKANPKNFSWIFISLTVFEAINRRWEGEQLIVHLNFAKKRRVKSFKSYFSRDNSFRAIF